MYLQMLFTLWYFDLTKWSKLNTDKNGENYFIVTRESLESHSNQGEREDKTMLCI